MFGLKVKKKKKVNTDVVLANKAALDSEAEGPPEAASMVEEENTEDQPGTSAVRPRIIPSRKRAKLKTRIQDIEGKPQSFQIAINITEARQLVGENIDPSVVIEIGDEKKQTSVKEGTNAPFYNEYFVFDFFAHKEVFFDRVIKLSVMHTKMLRSFFVGSFKVDVWTVYKQPGHQFINKWAVLTNPGDISTGVKGYVKCDISVSAKGDAVKPSAKASDADEQIDKNLLIPEGFPSERPWARFCVKVYRAEGLPRNNSSIMANVTKAFIGDNTALIDPYVVVSFFKQMGRTSTQKSTADPVWNEQIVFTEMFPPLCQRLKIQVWDEGSMSDVAIGTHYFDLKRISNEQDGDRGFLPTFGPAWINLYGSARNFSLGDDTVELNEGIGEGVSYRGRVYMELAVEILSGGAGSESKLSRIIKPTKDAKAGKAGGKDSKTAAGGGAGGGAGGAAGGAADDDKGKAVAAEVLPVESPPELNDDHKESFLLFGALFEATMIDRKIGDKPIIFEFSVGESLQTFLWSVLKSFIILFIVDSHCPWTCDFPAVLSNGFSGISGSVSPAVPRRRRGQDPSESRNHLGPQEMGLILGLWPMGAFIGFLTNDTVPGQGMFKSKKLCILLLMNEGLALKPCINVLTNLFVGRKLNKCTDWLVLHKKLDPGKTIKRSPSFTNVQLPSYGFTRSREIFSYREMMQRCKAFHAGSNTTRRQVIIKGSFLCHYDLSCLLAQSTQMTCTKCGPSTQYLIRQKLMICLQDSQHIITSSYDRRVPAESHFYHTVTPPMSKAFYLNLASSLLLLCCFFCYSQSDMESVFANEWIQSTISTVAVPEEQEGGIYSVPANIRPFLSTYRIEVLFWGLRELKKVQFLSVDRPQVFIECAGKTLRSSVIQKYKSNPNFTTLVDAIELELPENEHLHPPLSITVVDWRAFGRSTLVGNHVINNLRAYKYHPPPALPAPKQTHKPSKAAYSPGPSLPQETQSTEEQSQLDGKSSSAVATTDQDVLITVEDDPTPPPPPPAPPSPKESRRKRDSKITGTRGRSTKRKKRTIADESAECVIDWWSKYYASVEKQAKHKDGSLFPQVFEKENLLLVSSHSDGDKKKPKPKGALVPTHGVPTKLATLKLYSKELEAEFGPFDDWVKTYELFRGKANEEEGATEERFVGKFKGRFCLYKLPELETDDGDKLADTGHFRVTRGIPPNSQVQVLIRVYIVSASNLHPADPDGKADPYIVLRLGKNEIKDRDNYIPKELNPVFGRSFEMQATFPQESLLSVVIYDFDLVGGDDLIGETRIDLENRFYSRHRATCGLPAEYSLEGYNAWRDCLKPSELLTKLCKDNGLDGPEFRPGRITVADKVFTGKTVYMNEDEPVESYEHLSLKILHRWSEMPVVGCKLVPEHIETRTLFNKARPGMDQGQVQMWVDMFPMDLPHPGTAVDISPRKPKGYELRIIIWNTEDVILEDTNFLTGQQSSDIYVKGWLKGLEDDRQETDVHYNSLTGEGNFNWRFVFPFNYLPAEKVVVVSKRENIFSLDKTEQKLPAILIMQVWDFETLSSDDFLGTVELDLHGFPRGAKTAKACKVDMMTDVIDRISIFQQKRARGWWPFSKSGELTGKVEAEFHLVTAEEAEKIPVGRARKEPEPLPKPNRPDTSFSWFVNPFKCFFHLVWRSYKKYIIIALVILITMLFLALLFYTLPGAISQKIV
ncbi:Fer-1-like protein 6 [Channa argus]|uniref:Fer-1-like protein 6 n=1 Tax=Channa argus TaxID=215402 RepID=A0A6G1PWZ7_CHAAH|nr:Fer-1-like protein 6 [Channa argus]